ncbi:hypothetical protein HAX54_004788 [Datura stramonium]|uniref:Uncharacterized protein n=1 Tax=Datura stramonium TaxID=4076 RepID=A0ABS8T7I9_DATST|nr:hypothetical protein [Datura stramonium]
MSTKPNHTDASRRWSAQSPEMEGWALGLRVGFGLGLGFEVGLDLKIWSRVLRLQRPLMFGVGSWDLVAGILSANLSLAWFGPWS